MQIISGLAVETVSKLSYRHCFDPCREIPTAGLIYGYPPRSQLGYIALLPSLVTKFCSPGYRMTAAASGDDNPDLTLTHAATWTPSSSLGS